MDPWRRWVQETKIKKKKKTKNNEQRKEYFGSDHKRKTTMSQICMGILKRTPVGSAVIESNRKNNVGKTNNNPQYIIWTEGLVVRRNSHRNLKRKKNPTKVKFLLKYE